MVSHRFGLVKVFVLRDPDVACSVGFALVIRSEGPPRPQTPRVLVALQEGGTVSALQVQWVASSGVDSGTTDLSLTTLPKTYDPNAGSVCL